MNAKDVIKFTLNSTKSMLSMYLADLSDADFLVRPVPGANHIAWQLGHLISAEQHMLKKEFPGAAFPELPAGFDEQHSNATAAVDPPRGFRSKEEYLSLFNRMRDATLALLGKLPDADLDKPNTGQMAKFAPTLGALFMLVSNHTLMHAGQFTVLRRKLGKPILF